MAIASINCNLLIYLSLILIMFDYTLDFIKTAFTTHNSCVEIQMNCIIIYVFEMLNNLKGYR
jgi:hypothetical protein